MGARRWRMFVWFIRCTDPDDPVTGGAYARCYVKAANEEGSRTIARTWIIEDTDYEPTDDMELIRVWDEGQRPGDPEEDANLDEAWASEVGSIWLHTWDPTAPDAAEEPD